MDNFTITVADNYYDVYYIGGDEPEIAAVYIDGAKAILSDIDNETWDELNQRMEEGEWL